MSPRVYELLRELGGLLMIVGAGALAGGWWLDRWVTVKGDLQGLPLDEALRRKRARDEAERIRLDPITEEDIARAQAQARRSA